MPHINFVIPVKSLEQAKTRLSGILSPIERENLVKDLLSENLRRLRLYFPGDNILLVTPDESVIRIANHYSVDILQEKQATGLNQAIEAGTRWSIEKGYTTQVVICPDVARLNGQEMKLFIESASGDPSIVICAAKDKGTNAILTTPPNAIPFWYGKKSSEVMASFARARDISCRALNFIHMGLDIDSPDDLLRAFPDYLKRPGLPVETRHRKFGNP